MFSSYILRIHLYGKITKHFPLDSIVYGVIGLPINIYSVGRKKNVVKWMGSYVDVDAVSWRRLIWRAATQEIPCSRNFLAGLQIMEAKCIWIHINILFFCQKIEQTGWNCEQSPYIVAHVFLFVCLFLKI